MAIVLGQRRDAASTRQRSTAAATSTSDTSTTSRSLWQFKSKLCLALWIVPSLVFLLRQVYTVTDYHNNQWTLGPEDALAMSSSLWMPTNKTATLSMLKFLGGIDKPVNGNTNNQDRQVSSSTSHQSNSNINKFSSSTIYWNYDEAAPPIQSAKTHQLSSLPLKYRLEPMAWTNLTSYLLQPENQYPNKLHLFDMNPSITILPKRYQLPIATGTDDNNNNNSNDKDNIPTYLASYRVVHYNNCFDYSARVLMYGGGNAALAFDRERKLKTDYLGLALLRKDLSILADVVVLLNHTSLKRGYNSYDDFRLFTLHDELYLSTRIMIGRLQLGGLVFQSSDNGNLPTATEPANIKAYTSAEDGDNVDDYQQLEHVDKERKFAVYLSRKPSCPFTKSNHFGDTGSKNLLYFVDHQNDTMVEYLMSSDPNDIRRMHLNQPCITYTSHIPLKKPPRHKPLDLEPTFANFHQNQSIYTQDQIKTFLIADRGSACCVRMTHNGQEYLVGVSHPKTPFPGKRLPPDVKPNIYLSRFFAMEGAPPYRMVARTGAFCFGYSQPEEVQDTLLWNHRYVPMTMSGHAFDCPRIHFIMSMIDNVQDDSQVIISYGVSDCTSRFITVNKADIQAMLWPIRDNNTSSSGQ